MENAVYENCHFILKELKRHVSLLNRHCDAWNSCEGTQKSLQGGLASDCSQLHQNVLLCDQKSSNTCISTEVKRKFLQARHSWSPPVFTPVSCSVPLSSRCSSIALLPSPDRPTSVFPLILCPHFPGQEDPPPCLNLSHHPLFIST